VVAIHLPNCPQFAIAYHGVLLSGATYTPANPLLPPGDLAAQLADSGAVLAVSFSPASKVLAAVREQTAVRKVVLTDRAQALDPAHRVDTGEFGTRGGLEEYLAGQPTTRHRWTSTSTPTWRTWPTPAVPPAAPRASRCRTATSWSTRCSTPAG